MIPRKPMTTKEIIFDSKNLPVNIDEVEWVLKGDCLEVLNRFEQFVETMKAINEHMGYQFTQPIMNAIDDLRKFKTGYPPVGEKK